MLAEERFYDALYNQSKNSITLKETEIGFIVSVNPLQVKVKGLTLIGKNIYINPDLLEYDEVVSCTTTVNNEHSHSVQNIHHYCKLKKDDMVAITEMDNGKYYISSKVILGGE